MLQVFFPQNISKILKRPISSTPKVLNVVSTKMKRGRRRNDDEKKRRFGKFLPTVEFEDHQDQQTSSADKFSSSEPEEIEVHEVEAENDFDDFPLIDVENILTEQDESYLDPETGEISQPSTQPQSGN